MTVSSEIDQFIAENGGNARDALNVALARLGTYRSVVTYANLQLLAFEEILERMQSVQNDTASEIVAVQEYIKSLKSERDRLQKRLDRISEKHPPYSEECIRAIEAIEEKYSTEDTLVELVSIQHHEEIWQMYDKLQEDYDRLAAELRDRQALCETEGPHTCPFKLRTREGMGSL